MYNLNRKFTSSIFAFSVLLSLTSPIVAHASIIRMPTGCDGVVNGGGHHAVATCDDHPFLKPYFRLKGYACYVGKCGWVWSSDEDKPYADGREAAHINAGPGLIDENSLDVVFYKSR